MNEGTSPDDTGRDEWVLVLTMWPKECRGFDRPALERFNDRIKAEDIRHEYAKNDGLQMYDYTVIRREKIDTLPFEVSFDNCGDSHLSGGGSE